MIAAIVTISLVKITGFLALDSAVGGLSRPYALATIQRRPFGRSAPVPRTEDSTLTDAIDFDAEPTFWFEPVPVDAGEDVVITLRIVDDHGDAAPTIPWDVRTILVASPWTSGTRTFTDAGITLTYRVETRPVPSPSMPASVPRIATGTDGTLATLGARPVLVTELEDILGLHQPVAGGGTKGNPGAIRVAGYTSRDHAGRIYVNRSFTDRGWKKGYQAIHVKAVVREVMGRIPDGARMQWHVFERDDPSNDGPDVHFQWHREIDPNDCDELGSHVGAKLGDDRGTIQRSPRWEEVPGYALAVQDARVARSAIVDRRSEVILHCPDLPGDNLALVAFVDAMEDAECFGARTGTMSMWSLVEVEVLKMDSANSLEPAIANVQAYLAPAFTQLDFTAESPIPDDSPLVPSRTSPVMPAANALFEREFKNRESPGWFCLVAAGECEPNPPPAAPSKPWREDVATTLRRQPDGSFAFVYFSKPSSGELDGVKVRDASGAIQVFFKIGLVSTQPDGRVLYRLVNHALHPDPDATLRGVSISAPLQAGPDMYGLPFSTTATGDVLDPDKKVTLDILLKNPTSFVTAGISPFRAVPDAPTAGTTSDLWWGTTAVFTKCSAYAGSDGKPSAKFAERAAQSIAHELVHGLGLSHCCGRANLNTPRTNACIMHYDYMGLLNLDRTALSFFPAAGGGPASSSRAAGSLCGKHVAELRTTRLHLHRGFLWHDKQ